MGHEWSLRHLSFLLLGVDCNLQCLLGQRQFFGDTHVSSCRRKALFDSGGVVLVQRQTSPRELDPNPALIVVIGRSLFLTIIVVDYVVVLPFFEVIYFLDSNLQLSLLALCQVLFLFLHGLLLLDYEVLRVSFDQQLVEVVLAENFSVKLDFNI